MHSVRWPFINKRRMAVCFDFGLIPPDTVSEKFLQQYRASSYQNSRHRPILFYQHPPVKLNFPYPHTI